MPAHVLVLLRHAKSDWSTGEADRHRPLAERGRRQAPEAGRWLAAHLPPVDHVVTSPATRARQTWELAGGSVDAPPPTVDDRVYAASLDELCEVVAGLPEEAGLVVLVGHNPGLEELVEHLSGEPVPMPTSALAVVGLEGAWTSVTSPGCGTLRAAGRPPA